MLSGRSIVAVLVIVALAALWYQSSRRAPNSKSERENPPAAVAPTTGSITRAPSADTLGSIQGFTVQHANPLERASNLAEVFRANSGGNSVLERHVARRAWSACFPTFIGAKSKLEDLDRFSQSMPRGDPNNAARLNAYAALRERCATFFYLSADEIATISQQLEGQVARGEAASVGELALKSLLEGREDAADIMARRAISSGDGYSIASLQEYLHRVATKRAENAGAIPSVRSDLHAMAVALAACEFDLDCSDRSLSALQLCTNFGACAGDLRDRMLASLNDPKDRAAVREQQSRTVAAIRSLDYKALGLE